MFVLCPHCQFLVAVDPVSGLPPPRCPRCGGVLTESPVPAPVAEAPPTAAQDELPVPVAANPPQDDALASPEALPATSGEPAETTEPAPAGADVPAPVTQPLDELPEPVPRALQAHAPPTTAWPRKRISSALVILVLSLLLALQLLLADRAQLAADAQWRPTLAVLCDVLRCTLPPWREPAAFTVLARDVTPDLKRPGVLHVTARFRNDARWPQPWPTLLLTLSDADGRVAGERAFAPAEYRGNAATKNTLASGQSATITMDVIEPAPRIVAFTFDFR
jgi:uncharacterized protein DUF3426